MDITGKKEEKQILEKVVAASEEFLQTSELNYQRITDTILDISGAEYAAFNLYDNNGSSFTTVAISAPQGIIKKASSLLGFGLSGRKWGYAPVLAAKAKPKTVTRFLTMAELAKDMIPKHLIPLFEKIFNIGEMIFVKIQKEDTIIGDFSLVMAKDKEFKNEVYVEIYARQAGLHIMRCRSESRLTESEERYRLLIDNASEGVLVAQGANLKYVNPMLSELTGFSKEELLTIPFIEFVYQEDRALMIGNYSKRIKGEKLDNRYPVRILTKNSQIKWVEMSGVKIEWDGLPAILNFVTDITERKQADEALSESKNLVLMSQKIGHTGSWVYNLDTDKIWATEEACRIFGYPPIAGYFTIDDIEACIPEREYVHQALVDLITNGWEYNLEYEVNPSDGSHLKVVHSVASLEKDLMGNPLKVIGFIQDITERKRAEEALRSSEDKFQKAFYSSPYGHAITAMEPNKVIEVNDAYLKTLGYCRDEVVGHNTYELGIWVNPEERERALGILKEKGSVRDVEVQLRTKSGDILNILLAAEIISIDGKDCMLTTAYNITDLKKAESALLMSEEKYRRILETTNEGLIVLDKNGLVTLVNRQMAVLLGYTSEEMLGRKIELFICEEELSGHLTQMEMRKNGQNSVYERCFRCKDGRKLHAIISATTIADAEGNFSGSSGMITDITARKQSEIALAKSQTLTNAIVDSTTDMIWSVDPVNFGLLTFNQGLSSYFLKNRGMHIQVGMRPEDLFPPGEFVKKWQDYYQRALRESPYTVQYNAYAGTRTLHLTFNILRRDGDIFGISVFARDITERMQMEEALEEKSNDLIKAYDATLQGWSNALELREHETAGHCQRVVQLTVDLSKLMNIDLDEILEIQRGALLHDIGKMGIPDSILLKPGPLTDDEWIIMRQHPIYAYNLLSNIPYLKKALEIPYCHHEKWDGSGYPRKLSGLEIPVSARIFAVIDVWDALSSNRPYRPAWPQESVTQYLNEQRGKHFDPQVVESFQDLVKKNKHL